MTTPSAMQLTRATAVSKTLAGWAEAATAMIAAVYPARTA
jgi:hypothetical protein